MISGHTDALFILHHFHHEPQNVGRFRTAVNQIANKNGFPICRILNIKRAVRTVQNFVAKLFKQFAEFVETSVHVADNIKRPVLIFTIVP